MPTEDHLAAQGRAGDETNRDQQAAPQSEGDYQKQAEELTQKLTRALNQVFEESVGSSPRPITLRDKLGLDKSIASRILRALRSEGAFEFLHHVPAPTGLRKIMKSASKLASEGSIETLRAAIEDYDLYLGTFAGGRAGLEAAISGFIPEVRARGEQQASQSIFKSMSFLLGCEIEGVYAARIHWCDGDQRKIAHCWTIQGFRRFRAGASMLVGGLPKESKDGRLPSTIDGQATDDLRDCCLSPFTTIDPLSLQVLNGPNRNLLLFGEDQPKINEPVDLSFGLVEDAEQRFRSEGKEYDRSTYLSRKPARALVIDQFVASGCFVEGPPQVTVRLSGGATRFSETPEASDLEALDLQVDVQELATDPDTLETSAVRNVPERVSYLFSRLGLDPAQFKLYRVSVLYPIPLVELSLWFQLPTR